MFAAGYGSIDAAATGSLMRADAEVPAEPPVYEDLFPTGTVPSEPCPLHDTRSAISSAPGTITSGDTPLVDAALRNVSSGDVVIVRTLGPDGTMRMVMRQRRNP